MTVSLVENLRSDKHREVVSRAVDAMRRDLSAPWTLDEIAGTVSFSSFYFHRIFRETTTLPPARFLAALRMAEAKRLLLHSKLTVAAISGRVGYTSVGTFTTQFGRLVGMPPQRLRRLAREVTGRLVRRAPMVLLGLSPLPGDAVAEGPGLSAEHGPQWTLSEATAPAGDYRVRVLALEEGWPVTASLVDQVPDSYRTGVVTAGLSSGRWSPPNPRLLHRPWLIDPPVLTAEPLRLAAAACP
ncbi:helix-turn-helix transcriptional regulator [Dactylosporangium sp. CA-139066]|uniref:helix-turn-helix transcriptional regulator n=1 Tax=Dactylosporangium sp. CA-139066 TaxID=3239930 RepID=UPI003D8E76C0